MNKAFQSFKVAALAVVAAAWVAMGAEIADSFEANADGWTGGSRKAETPPEPDPTGYPLPSAAHAQVYAGSGGRLSRAVSIAGTEAQVDLMMFFERTNNALPTGGPGDNAQLAVACDPAGNLHLWCTPRGGGSSAWAQLTATPVVGESGSWMRLSFMFDYAKHMAQVRLNGTPLMTEYGYLRADKEGEYAEGAWYEFPAAANTLAAIAAEGAVKLDDVVMTEGTNAAYDVDPATGEDSVYPVKGAAKPVDVSGERIGISYAWYNKYGLGVEQELGTKFGGGLTALQSYIAGVDPTLRQGLWMSHLGEKDGKVQIKFPGEREPRYYRMLMSESRDFSGPIITNDSVAKAAGDFGQNIWTDSDPIGTGVTSSMYYRVVASVPSVPDDERVKLTVTDCSEVITNFDSMVFVFKSVPFGGSLDVTQVPKSGATMDYLIVGGGGSGGYSCGGGGGGGEVIAGSNVALEQKTYAVTVGAGGIPSSGSEPTRNGGTSSFVGVSAIGGGGGAGFDQSVVGSQVANGGGGSKKSGHNSDSVKHNLGGSGSYDNNAQGGGGGGGGMQSAGGAGSQSSKTGGAGGEGIVSSITGKSCVYGSGGGGSATTTAGVGGTNAGVGGVESKTAATAALPGFGGGGGGGARWASGGLGGSGTVIVKIYGKCEVTSVRTEGLPTGYTQLASLKSADSVGQHISLDYRATQDTDIRTKVKFDRNGTNQCVFCSRKTTADKSFTLFGYYDSTSKKNCFRFDYESNGDLFGTLETGKDYEITVDTVATSPGGQSTITIASEGTELYTATKSVTSGFMTAMSMALFSSYNYANNAWGWGNAALGMTMYYFQIYEGDLLMRDLVPCERTSDSKQGLFDRLTGRFYELVNN